MSASYKHNPEVERRRELLGQLLSEHGDWEQTRMLEWLVAHGAAPVDLSAVSRDIAALGYVKVRGEYVPHILDADELAEAEARERVRMHVHEVYEATARITCLRTDVGYALGVGLALRGMRPQWGNMAITWGIDDVVIISRSAMADRIRELMR